MRAALWIAASGFLLASGSAYAGTGRPIDNEGTVRPGDLADAYPAPQMDVIITGQGQQSSGPDLSKAQAAEVGPREKAVANPNVVTVDPGHPGGLFPWGG
jgi:hypothetical protein